jgi:hypothetical protein
MVSDVLDIIISSPIDRFTEIEYKKLYVATSVELVRNTNT